MKHRHYLSLTALIIVALGVPATYSILAEPVFKEATQGTSGSGKTQRGVASVAVPALEIFEQSKERNKVKAQSVAVEIKCQQTKQQAVVEGTLLRLHGGCGIEKWKNLSIINQANGFTAAVMEIPQGFTTDYIDLKSGENVVTLSGTDKTGAAVSREIKIQSRLPASAENQ